MKFKFYALMAAAILTLRHEASFAELRTIQEKNASGIVVKQRSYEDGKLVEAFYFNGSTGDLGTWLRFRYPSPGHVIKTQLSVKKDQPSHIMTQEEWTGLDAKNETTKDSVKLRTWIYSEDPPFQLKYIESYAKDHPSRIQAKQYLDEKNNLKSTIHLTYREGKEKPIAFVETDVDGEVISKYALYEKYDLRARLQKQGKTPEEIDALQTQRENPNKFLVAIIDSGFDYNHAELVTKWWNNPEDPIDGVDNDGNGWVDDNFGWDQVANQYLPSEGITPFFRHTRPLSHGTHVAAIASRGLNNIGLIGFGGEYTDVAYMDKVSAFIKKHKVKIVNMSLGIPLDHKDQLGLKASVRAYQRMIENNPETLFVVASGNEMKNLDVHANRQYPASFMQPNVMKVGALDVGSLEAITQKTKMADFSNWGKNSVDILAPGWDVVAARLGGGTIAHSGTSMASPYMVNQVVQLWSALPHLTAQEVRELFIATAHKLSPAPDIRSGGYVDLKAALLMGRLQWLKGRKTHSYGPNCWNASTYIAGLSQALHYTNETEFRFLIDSPLCQKVALNQTRQGDIIALRRFDSMGGLLPAPFMSEVHGYTDLGNGTGLTKNGPDPSVGYEVQSKTEILNFYKSQEFKNCKIIGLSRKDCILKETAYRCQSLRDYFKGQLNILENDLLLQTEALEQELGNSFAHGRPFSENKLDKVAELKQKIEKIQQQGSSQFFVEALSLRLNSLSSQFLKK